MSASTQPIALSDADFDDPVPPDPDPQTYEVFRWWQTLVLLVVVGLCDLTIYQGEGFAGYAVLFVAAPLLFCLVRFRPREALPLSIIGVMLLVLAARLGWWGGGLQVTLGFALLAAFAMTLSGLRPFPVETLVFVARIASDAYLALSRQSQATKARARMARRTAAADGRWNALSVLLPFFAVVVFGLLFVLANPDLAAALGEGVERFALELRAWLEDFAPGPLEVLFWIAAFWILAGALRTSAEEHGGSETYDSQPQDEPSELFGPFRNMLCAVIVLFAVYLVFEFSTLWFREFPEGFYYSGYAHEGAFWLTVALALTTFTLSLVFRGSMLQDPRQISLRKLAWVWSMESLLLAVAVYHRLLIYVGFNGMTRMRVVGFCGISAVVVGFLIVLYKIANGKNFLWLIRRQLTALFCFTYLYAVVPVDALVMRYNTARILAGDPAPCVQISVHPIDPDGLRVIVPLLDSDNGIIREGVSALLAEQFALAKQREREREESGWTAIQFADRSLLERLSAIKSKLAFANVDKRKSALRAFHKYAYQWY